LVRKITLIELFLSIHLKFNLIQIIMG